MPSDSGAGVLSTTKHLHEGKFLGMVSADLDENACQAEVVILPMVWQSLALAAGLKASCAAE